MMILATILLVTIVAPLVALMFARVTDSDDAYGPIRYGCPNDDVAGDYPTWAGIGIGRDSASEPMVIVTETPIAHYHDAAPAFAAEAARLASLAYRAAQSATPVSPVVVRMILARAERYNVTANVMVTA